jgi:hypothetical protein
MLSVFDEIGFNEEHHKYTFESAPHITPLSVSGIIGQYKKPFDSDFHAGRKAESLGIDKQVILDQWAESARIGCDKGTISHQYLETLLESEQFEYPEKYNHVKDMFLALKPQLDKFLSENIIFLIGRLIKQLIVNQDIT